MTQIYGYKLLSGSDIVGKLDSETDTVIKLDKAAIVHLGRDQNNQPIIQFMPPAILIKGQGPASIELERSSIAYRYELEGQYETGYLSQTSDIFLPS